MTPFLAQILTLTGRIRTTAMLHLDSKQVFLLIKFCIFGMYPVWCDNFGSYACGPMAYGVGCLNLLHSPQGQ